MPSSALAQGVATFSFSLTIVVSGYGLPIDQMPDYWAWFCLINPYHWIFAGLTSKYFSDFDTEDGNILSYYSISNFKPIWVFPILFGYITIYLCVTLWVRVN